MASVSIILILFLTAVAFLLVLFINPPKRWALLSALSLYYLACLNYKIIIGFLLLAFISYFILKSERKSKWTVYSAIGINLFFLICFKYIFPNSHELLIPLGLSIFVFQQIAILIESNKDFQKISIYQFFTLSFFWGNFATGPIIAEESLKEFLKPISLSSRNFIHALSLAMIGLFKIYVIAGNLSHLTKPLFMTLSENQNYLIPFLANKYEIYANFSGYTDLAISTGIIFGLKLPQNFDQPFRHSSIIEFWRRWHMSLTSWIRKYVFYPLLTTRLSKFGPTFLMLITFCVFALWHGLKFTYFLYAFIQVILIYLTYHWRKIFPTSRQSSLLNILQWLWFYVVLISVPGILFKSQDLSQFYKIMSAVIFNLTNNLQFYFEKNAYVVLICTFSILILEVFQRYSLEHFIEKISIGSKLFRFFCFITLGLLILFFGSFEQDINFVYSIY